MSLETKLHQAQAAYISQHYGKDAAERADYGPVIQLREAPLQEVATRIYGYGVLCSMALKGNVYHEMIDCT